MRKVLFAVLSLVLIAASAQAVDLVPKVGGDLHTNVYWDDPSAVKEEVKPGVNVGIELRGDISNYFGFGLGFEYNFPRNFRHMGGVDDTKFSVSPIYASIFFYPLETFSNTKPYIRANIGYGVVATNELGDNVKGGLTYGGGIGFEYRRFIFEIIAANYKQTFDYLGQEVEADYKKITLAIGYKFTI